jgi:protein-disulfide isomerase
LKKQFFTAVWALAFIGLAGCSPTASQLQKTLEENPEVLFAVIEKHPAKFFETVRKAQMVAQESGQAEQLKEELKRVIGELKNPKTPVVEEARVNGNPAAQITIVEYSDYNCGHCGRAHETMSKLKAEYGDKIRFVFKQYPVLDGRTKTSMMAAEYSEAVSLQSQDLKYKFHSAVFEAQGDLQEKGEEALKAAVKAAGADLAKVQKDRKSSTVKNRIKQDMEEASKFGFNGTPAFLINGASLPGAYPYEAFKQIIDHILGGGSGEAKTEG